MRKSNHHSPGLKYRILFPVILGTLAMAMSAVAEPPATKREDVTDEYHGVEVVDPYRWLENANDPAVKEWMKVQNVYARSFLDNFDRVAPIRERVTEILSDKSISYSDLKYAGGRFFRTVRKPPKEQPFVTVLDSLDESANERILVDPEIVDASAETSIDWYIPSPDGTKLAVSFSVSGTERGDLVIFDVASGEQMHETIPHVNSGTAGGDIAWNADATGVWYTRHFKVDSSDAENHDVYQQLWFHKFGDLQETDTYELGERFPEIAEIQLDFDVSSGRLLATVQEGDGGKFAHYLRSPDGEWRQFSKFGDGIIQAVFAPESNLYVVSRVDAPRGKILKVAADSLEIARAPVLVPESEETIVSSGEAFWGEQTVIPTESRLFVLYQQGGPSHLQAFDHDGNSKPAPQQLPVSTVHGAFAIDDGIIFANTSYVDPDAWIQFDVATSQTTPLAMANESPVDMSDVTVVREMATSKDGTQIPINILLPPGVKRDGNNPCVVYGYGGYGINLTPQFRSINKLLAENGVIYAVANLRGGGEFGEQWHREGALTNKQNVFDDFAAAVAHMSKRKYTRPKLTATMGGSNGGLLMGAVLTQHPDKMKAVVAMVGIYDMLRNELTPNGKFNVAEFGSVEDEKQFRALLGYSPYHRVTDEANYPAVLFVTGENDPRVDPMQSRKMTARLQAATTSGSPILLRTSANAGHGRDNSLSESIEQWVDIYAYLFDQLDVKTK